MSNTFTSPLTETSWLSEHLHESNLRIVDCSVLMQHFDDGTFAFISGKNAWEQAHIPGSIFVDVHTQLSDQTHELALMMPAPRTLVETMKTLGIGDDSQVVLYDSTNHAWAARVWWMLRVCGFDNAAVLNGGWTKWQAEGREVSDEKSEYAAAESFTINARPELMANKSKVLESIGREEITLIHSLPLPTFTGEVRPYTRPGRISGSKNLYCETLIDDESRTYIDLEDIRNKFNKIGALSAESVITYCGGGIAASSNAFALTLLGVDNVAIYDGSLSEWTLDPDLPMETG
jgi:thiosulfate/3-mercaptopyruvate sulfurtransferase